MIELGIALVILLAEGIFFKWYENKQDKLFAAKLRARGLSESDIKKLVEACKR